jgi:hypothetical protein
MSKRGKSSGGIKKGKMEGEIRVEIGGARHD